jgi:hypothetical protein
MGGDYAVACLLLNMEEEEEEQLKKVSFVDQNDIIYIVRLVYSILPQPLNLIRIVTVTTISPSL